MGTRLHSHPTYRYPYGVYTVGDRNFFPGVVANINALRSHGYQAPIAVVDVGFHSWMVDYLASIGDVLVLDVSYLRKTIRYTDCRSNEEPVMENWGYKAFAIEHFQLFETFTFIDADYLPLCNLEEELRHLAEAGQFLSTEDGMNRWDDRHRQAIGVESGNHVNINTGFFTLSMRHFDWLVREWRNVSTRKRPFRLWYGDQGAMNAILDKYGIQKTAFDKLLWNQTWLNEPMQQSGDVTYHKGSPPYLIHTPTGQRFKGWHGWGWHKPWHCLGIDEYRSDPVERSRFFEECQTKIPQAAVQIFRHFLFDAGFSGPLKQSGHQILVG